MVSVIQRMIKDGKSNIRITAVIICVSTDVMWNAQEDHICVFLGEKNEEERFHQFV